jgi:hypothetical protein
MVTGDYRDFFVVLATSAATLIGLLFVALSVAGGRTKNHPQVIREFRAAAALFAFTNVFTVSLFGLVPGTGVAIAAVVVSGVGILFTAAGLRTTLSLPQKLQHRRTQFALILGLLAILGLELYYGILLMRHPHNHSDLSNLGYILIVSLLVGIGRSWEMVGDRDTGLLASIGLLIGHDPTGAIAAAARAEDDDTDTTTASVTPGDP